MGVCPAWRAKNEAAANCALAIVVGWNGSNRDSLDMEHLA